MMEVSPLIYAAQCAALVKFVNEVEAQDLSYGGVSQESIDAAKRVVMDMVAAVVEYEAESRTISKTRPNLSE